MKFLNDKTIFIRCTNKIIFFIIVKHFLYNSKSIIANMISSFTKNVIYLPKIRFVND